MAELTHTLTHTEDALERLISQFRDKTKIRGFLSGLVQEFQNLEDVAWDLYSKRNLTDAPSDFLNIIGEIVGESRNGRTDEQFRIRIIAKIGRNTSKGTSENIITVFNLLTNSAKSQFYPYHPAHVMLYADHDITSLDTSDIYDFTQLVCAAGVKLLPLAWTSDFDDAFKFDTGKGFGDLNDPTLGGKFASLVP